MILVSIVVTNNLTKAVHPIAATSLRDRSREHEVDAALTGRRWTD